MLHYSCDLCKRPINTNSDVRHVVKIEVFPAVEDVPESGCCHADCNESDADHLEEMQELLEHMDEHTIAGHDLSSDDEARSMHFDLCDACRQRFVKNPLGLRSGKQLDFSNN